jgi:hypothetical protein
MRRMAGEHLAVHLLEELVDPRSAGEVLVTRPVQRARPRRRIGQRQILAEHVDDVHAEAVDAPVQPPAHHVVHSGADVRVLPVQVGLLAGEDVQVVLPGLLVPLPGRPGEVRLPVGRLRTGGTGDVARPRVAPPVPVALRVVPARPRLHEPRVLVAGVVDDEVHQQADAPRVQGVDQFVEVGEGAEQRIDVAVVTDVVAVVIHRRPVHR